MAENTEFWEIIKDQLGAVSNSLAENLDVATGGLTAMLLSLYFNCKIDPIVIQKELDKLNQEKTNQLVKTIEASIHYHLNAPTVDKPNVPKPPLPAEINSNDDTETYLKRKMIDSRDVNLYVLAWVTIIGFYALVCVLMWRPIPSGSDNVLFILFGTMSSGFGMVLGYFFGGSKGSADKTKLMAAGQKKAL